MARTSDSRKAGAWQTRMGRFARSGLTVARFCEQEGVSTASFYGWRRRLADDRVQRHGDGGQRRASPQAVNTPLAVENAAPFQVVRVTPSVATLSIHLPGGARLEVPTGNRDTVRDILRELTRPGATLGGGEPAC
jgi:hypothetical protein